MKIIDFHAHILPGVDHGSKDMKMSLRQLELAGEAGVDVIVATSHFYAHRMPLPDFLSLRDQALCSLREAARGRGLPEVLPGAEVLLFAGMNEMKGLETLCISGTNVILLEMPLEGWTTSLLRTIQKIEIDRGLKAIMAHVDRYPVKAVERLLALPVDGQLNAKSLNAFCHRSRLIRLVSEGRIVALGSDIHGVESGYQSFQKARLRLKGLWEPLMARTEALLGI